VKTLVNSFKRLIGYKRHKIVFVSDDKNIANVECEALLSPKEYKKYKELQSKLEQEERQRVKP
jgi:hypothetical protein